MTFESVYVDYSKFVLNNFRKYPQELAQELVQETFIRLYKSFKNYDPKYSMATFLITCINQVKWDYHDHNSYKDRAKAIFVDIEEAQYTANDDDYSDIERRQEIKSLVKKSNLNSRELAIMNMLINGEKPESIAVMLDITTETIRHAYNSAITKISKRYVS